MPQDEQYILLHLLKAITTPNAAKFNTDFPAQGKRITPELTRAEHKAFNVREQGNDESHDVEASG
jgi:hypothetical protein